jgi:Flp pilus assembly pilin Flp
LAVEFSFSLSEGECEVKNLIQEFYSEEDGQDLIEYTILLAFVTLGSAAFFIGAGRSVRGIWSTVNRQLTAANTGAAS